MPANTWVEQRYVHTKCQTLKKPLRFMTVDVDLSDNFSSEARSKIFDNFFALKNARPIYSLCPFSCSQNLLLQLQQYYCARCKLPESTVKIVTAREGGRQNTSVYGIPQPTINFLIISRYFQTMLRFVSSLRPVFVNTVGTHRNENCGSNL